MTKTNYYLLTGAIGGGKSTVMREISKANIRSVPEPAREILAEQRSIGSDGVPEQNPELFCKLMLSRALHDYRLAMSAPEVHMFDRAIPDMIAYAELFSIDPTSFYTAAHQYRYNPTVFFFGGWQQIYANDSERKIDFEGARMFGERLRAIYQRLGYHIVNVPFQPVEERASFILERLAASKDC